MSRNLPVLEPFYYLSHFEEMLSFLERNCAALLGDEEMEWIGDYRRLSREEKAWLVRFANRSGFVFRIDGLNYSELPDLCSVVPVLVKLNFLRLPSPEDRSNIIQTLTRAEIVGLLRPLKGVSSKKKPELLRILSYDEKLSELPEELLERFVIFQRSQTVEFLFFLYFGKQRRNLQAMTLRDLGIVKTRAGQNTFEVRFATREAATLSFFYIKLSEEISRAKGARLVDLVAGISEWPASSTADAEACRDREICRLGARLEQEGLMCDALEVYRRSTGHPARERTCRILLSRKEVGKAK